MNLPVEELKLLVIMTNISWNNAEILDEWKLAVITMIQKVSNDKADPKNYRPISLTNCLIKLIERIIKVRLVHFLNKFKIIDLHQSGFREKRQTTDNLAYFIEKVNQAKKVDKRTLVLFFTIAKAFDNQLVLFFT